MTVHAQKRCSAWSCDGLRLSSALDGAQLLGQDAAQTSHTSVALQRVGAMPMAQQLQLSKQLETEQSVRSSRALIVVTSGGKS
jgi:hypothetical protein